MGPHSGRSRPRQPLLVGERIRTLRKERDLTQAELASNIGIQQSDLCRMENGEYRVSLETLFKILSIFQINISEFFHEEAPPPISEREIDFLRVYQKLEPKAQREIRDFIRFKSTELQKLELEKEDRQRRDKSFERSGHERDQKE